jgi:imidazolonepropionase-like amidohydrolase
LLRGASALIVSGILSGAVLLSGTPAWARVTATFTMAPPPAGPPKALVGGSVVDVLTGSVIDNAVVIVTGETITAVGPADKTPIPAGATVFHMDGKWLIPGLINCHVHLGLKLPGAAGAALQDETDEGLVLRMEENGRKSLYSGVTTVRLVGEENGADFDLKAAINRREVVGPRIETAGEIIAPTGGHGYLEADGPYGLAKAIREQIKAGATWIKVAISGGIADSHGDISASPMTLEEIKTAVDVAHRFGVPITAHNGSPIAADEAMSVGIDGFEHGYHLTQKQLTQMKAQNVWLVPTIVVSQPGALEFYKKIGSPDWYLERVKSTGKDHWAMLQMAIKTGVQIALGTDQFPYEPNEGTTATIREAELYVDAGMTPIDALRAGTSTAARMLRLSDKVGAIAVGHYADIDVLEKDPTKDIHALRTIDFVMKGGDVIRNDAVVKASAGAEPALIDP